MLQYITHRGTEPERADLGALAPAGELFARHGQQHGHGAAAAPWAARGGAGERGGGACVQRAVLGTQERLEASALDREDVAGARARSTLATAQPSGYDRSTFRWACTSASAAAAAVRAVGPNTVIL